MLKKVDKDELELTDLAVERLFSSLSSGKFSDWFNGSSLSCCFNLSIVVAIEGKGVASVVEVMSLIDVASVVIVVAVVEGDLASSSIVVCVAGTIDVAGISPPGCNCCCCSCEFCIGIQLG